MTVTRIRLVPEVVSEEAGARGAASRASAASGAAGEPDRSAEPGREGEVRLRSVPSADRILTGEDRLSAFEAIYQHLEERRAASLALREDGPARDDGDDLVPVGGRSRAEAPWRRQDAFRSALSPEAVESCAEALVQAGSCAAPSEDDWEAARRAHAATSGLHRRNLPVPVRAALDQLGRLLELHDAPAGGRSSDVG